MSCRKTHTLEPLDVERLVYGFQAQIMDSAPHNVPENAKPLCLLETLSFAGDSEGFGEHTKSLIAARFAFEIEDNSISLPYQPEG